MFKRSDDQEWTRFRGALAKEREEATTTEEGEVRPPLTAAATSVPAPPAPAGAPDTSPSARPAARDVNVGLPARVERGPSPDALQVESLIGAHTTFEGTLKSEGPVRVLGSVQGELEAKGAVYVEESARVGAKLTASQVIVAGHVDGQIFCHGRVEIRPTGHVTGEIHAGALIVQEGAFFEGASKMAGTEGGSRG